jgi:hypothetical protein
MVPSVAWTSRMVSAIIGMKRVSKHSCHHHADGELESLVNVIVRTMHVLRTANT